MQSSTRHPLLNPSPRAVMKLAGAALLALSLAFQAPAQAAGHGKKSPAHAKHAVKKGKVGKIAAGKSLKAKAKLAKATKAAKAHKLAKQMHKHPKARKAMARAPHGKPATLAALPAAPKPAAVRTAALQPAIAKSLRSDAANPLAAGEQALPAPEFRVATAACQRDGKVYLLAGCNNDALPEVLTALSTHVESR